MADLWKLENKIHEEGYHTFCGVDEAGRGPLAGPVYAAAVILHPDSLLEGLDDSKKLSVKKREALFPAIQSIAEDWCIASASVEEIEEFNILGATFLAMNRAIEGLHKKPELALIDGNRTQGIHIPARAIIKGDAKCASIAAASILAKVSRDRYMEQLDAMYPSYGFSKHKGYGTKQHYEALRKFGPCPAHRPSFLRKMH
jgi:ribonuclease HII